MNIYQNIDLFYKKIVMQATTSEKLNSAPDTLAFIESI